jgi:hypothetical protein
MATLATGELAKMVSAEDDVFAQLAERIDRRKTRLIVRPQDMPAIV